MKVNWVIQCQREEPPVTMWSYLQRKKDTGLLSVTHLSNKTRSHPDSKMCQLSPSRIPNTHVGHHMKVQLEEWAPVFLNNDAYRHII